MQVCVICQSFLMLFKIKRGALIAYITLMYFVTAPYILKVPKSRDVVGLGPSPTSFYANERKKVSRSWVNFR